LYSDELFDQTPTMKTYLILLQFSVCGLFFTQSKAQISYFPPMQGDEWASENYQNFLYDSTYTDSLHAFLESKDSKAFIVVHDGKMVDETYFGSFTQDSFWYWASCGKSLTSFLMGQALDQGLIQLDDKVSDHLGTGWTSCTPQQEDQIKLHHILSMSSGLDGQVPNSDCTDPSCFLFKGDAGSLWFYHNAAYYMNHHVLEAASGKTLQAFTTQNLSFKSGLTGLWVGSVFFSKPRSAARFGLLMLNNGVWNGDSLLKNRDYMQEMTSSSQSMNPAYGRLFWLNGKDTLMIPGSYVGLAMNLNEEAPIDMYAALGKNDQKIYIVPSQKLVIVRMGNDPGDGLLGPSSFDTELWRHINRWRQVPMGLYQTSETQPVFPNPGDSYLQIAENAESVRLYDMQGHAIQCALQDQRMNTRLVPAGIYILRYSIGTVIHTQKIILQH